MTKVATVGTMGRVKKRQVKESATEADIEPAIRGCKTGKYANIWLAAESQGLPKSMVYPRLKICNPT